MVLMLLLPLAVAAAERNGTIVNQGDLLVDQRVQSTGQQTSAAEYAASIAQRNVRRLWCPTAMTCRRRSVH
jgi:hypothetical protein